MIRQLLILSLFITIAACNNSGKQQQTTNIQKPVDKGQEATAHTTPAASNDILGEWNQEYSVLDQNGNAILDPEDRNGTKSAMGFNYFKFNDDGSCLRDSDVKFKGTYEIIDNNGKRELKVTVNGFGETYKYTIVDPVTTELILYTSGVFMIYKRK